MEPTLYLSVLNNFENLFKTKKNYDVVIKAGGKQKEIYAHSIVLSCQSDYFDTIFSANWAEKKDGKYIIMKQNISSHTLENILRYLYCGQINLSINNGTDVLKLLVASDELGLIPLSKYVQKFLINNQKVFFRSDPIGILEIVFQHENFTTLKEYCLKTICQEPGILFGTDKILALPAHILESLLKREDLKLKEIEIWKNLIRWAHAQHPTVNKDPYEWNKDELTLMESALSRFIPLIRFHNITSEEYHNKVVPYDDLLPKKLKSEILKYYLVSGTKQICLLSPNSSNASEIDSVIIKVKHLALFADWIDKKDMTSKISLYKYNLGLHGEKEKELERSLNKVNKFNLILRGSRDGFYANTFHKNCDNKGATIVIAKIKGTNQLVGGYNPLDWAGCGVKITPDSFIFSFENYNYIKTGRIGRVIETNYAVQCFNSYGPVFGINRSGVCDIEVSKYGKWGAATNSYPNLDIPRNFEIDDYEVFQII